MYSFWGGNIEMEKNCLAKILGIGLIILFVGTSFTPSTISTTVTKHNSAHNMRILKRAHLVYSSSIYHNIFD